MKTLCAVYDLAVGPVSFDFIVFGIKARMRAQQLGAKRLHMVIAPDEKGLDGLFRDKRNLYSVEEMHWRLWNICIPACQLLDAGVSFCPQGWGQVYSIVAGAEVWPYDWNNQTLKNRSHLVGTLIEWARQGQRVPRLRASARAVEVVRRLTWGKPFVTMTTRNTYMGVRNSNLQEWEDAAQDIEFRRGMKVVRISDVSDALWKGQGFAELNLDLRMALYQCASLNLQENNGTASLCWFSSSPYRMFGANNNPEEWDGLFVKQGLPLGESWPWASDEQKLIYENATAINILREYDQWVGATK